MTDTGPTADDGAGTLHQFATAALVASRPRGRAQKGAPYAGLLLDMMLDALRAELHATAVADGYGAIRNTDTHSLQGVSSYEPPAVSGGH